ncbi:MAG TPA: methyltransferase [Dysgonamonadaceae bacterium]|nr:methyltransferase [Dysgonamonadaceae bacterium]
MSNNFFRFKQFTVFQDHCAMKVGTDGVLLGAWTDVFESSKVLDIGTGTGLIALMIAQRNCEAVIDAIDIDEGCVVQAGQNISGSPFAHRINVQHASFQNIAQQEDKNYDLIVSNPPYFQNALKSPCISRNTARHNDSLSFFEIISLGVSLLSESGRIALILPYEFKQAVLEHAATVNLFASRITNVHPLPHKPAKRLLIELQKIKTDCIEDNLTIELSRHRYSKEFEALTQEFYLER